MEDYWSSLSSFSTGHEKLRLTSEETLKREHKEGLGELMATMEDGQSVPAEVITAMRDRNLNLLETVHELQASKFIALDVGNRRQQVTTAYASLKRGEAIENPYHAPNGIFGALHYHIADYDLAPKGHYSVDPPMVINTVLLQGAAKVSVDVGNVEIDEQNKNAANVIGSRINHGQRWKLIDTWSGSKESAHDPDMLLSAIKKEYVKGKKSELSEPKQTSRAETTQAANLASPAETMPVANWVSVSDAPRGELPKEVDVARHPIESGVEDVLMSDKPSEGMEKPQEEKGNLKRPASEITSGEKDSATAIHQSFEV